ncbi:aldehyde dehydrogenase family protein [Psychrobacillus sp. NPDC096426]|uniref:aldehyde dehydrogenase family protein n=1 Tax=Psychrobacillus sp. NPDC096426 TaxID=3364491 RepID=UPI00382977B7
MCLKFRCNRHDQGCCTQIRLIQRIYVHENIIEEFMQIMEDATKRLVVGNPLDEASIHCSRINVISGIMKM